MFIKWEIPKGKMSVVMLFLMTFFCSFSHASDGPKDITVHANQVNEKAEGIVGTRTLLVRGDYNYPPYEYLDGHGKPQGFNVDIINAVTDVMGLKVEIDLGPWEEVRLQVEEGEIDALIGMFNTAERDKLFDFSIPHFIASYAVFVRDGSPIQSLDDARNSKIIVQLSDLGHDYLKENAITQDIIIKKDWSDVLTSLAKGEGDCAIVSRLQGTQLIGNLSIANIKAVGPPIIQRKYSIAVTQDNSVLLAHINEGLNIIKETGQYDQIYIKWFGIYTEQPLTFVKAFKYFFWVVLPLMALAVAGLLWSWTLRRRVNLRTNDLNNELLERRRTEDALRRSENQLREIFEILPIGLWFTDKDGNLQRGNHMGQQIWGVEPNLPISEYGAIKGCRLPSRKPIEPDEWALVKTVREGVTIIDELLEIESFDGKKKTILSYTAPVLDDNGNIDGAIVVNVDISDRMVLENQLRQSQKMEVVGTLAGGIAHDFNNILSVILGYAEMAKDDCQSGSSISKDLDEVLGAGNRAKGLVQQILAFSRQEDTERIILQPASIVKETIAMLRPSLPTTIEITQDIDTGTDLVFVDPSQLNQILMNLCTNAFHAMEETGGKLDISLKEVTLSNEDLVHEPDVTNGTFIQISIGDSGTGIAPTVKDNIFDPYFTTKETGKGTGIGLSIVHGIVKNYGGFISLYSELGEGAVFHVFLPVVEKEALTENEMNGQIPIGCERILFVDDEELLAQMGKSMLERLGYHVTVRTSSLEALETFQNQPDKFDIVITDQTMPGMTGSDLSRKMLQIRSDIPIILCTGYSTIISEEKAKAMGIKEFAFKPLAKKDIAKLIRKVLDVS
ncbi:MAG: signal transduction histidine kinase/ABC-type amino acid transport substrate-binding protein [Desulforhopalus sp.]|jgi:signal transduction histidine kinase/ABC-type amino acid transport substrate-binding protein